MSFLNEVAKKFDRIFDDQIIGYHVTLAAGVGAIVEGYKGLSELTDTQIKVRAGKTFVTVKGEQLQVKDINQNEICISGNVTCVEVGL